MKCLRMFGNVAEHCLYIIRGGMFQNVKCVQNNMVKTFKCGENLWDEAQVSRLGQKLPKQGGSFLKNGADR